MREASVYPPPASVPVVDKDGRLTQPGHTFFTALMDAPTVQGMVAGMGSTYGAHVSTLTSIADPTAEDIETLHWMQPGV